MYWDAYIKQIVLFTAKANNSPIPLQNQRCEKEKSCIIYYLEKKNQKLPNPNILQNACHPDL